MDSAASYRVDVHAFPGQHLLLQLLEADLWGDHWSAPQGVSHVHLTSPAEGRASVALSDPYKHELVSTRKENPKMSLIFQGVVLRVQPQKKLRQGNRFLAGKSQPSLQQAAKQNKQLFMSALLWWHFPLFYVSRREDVWTCGSDPSKSSIQSQPPKEPACPHGSRLWPMGSCLWQGFPAVSAIAVLVAHSAWCPWKSIAAAPGSGQTGA